MTPDNDTRPDEQPVIPEVEAMPSAPPDTFAALAAEFPQFDSPDQLPAEVRDMAATENISLLDAWLRYRWQEEKRVAAAHNNRLKAAATSTGSLSRGAVKDDPAPDAFLRAFRAAL